MAPGNLVEKAEPVYGQENRRRVSLSLNTVLVTMTYCCLFLLLPIVAVLWHSWCGCFPRPLYLRSFQFSSQGKNQQALHLCLPLLIAWGSLCAIFILCRDLQVFSLSTSSFLLYSRMTVLMVLKLEKVYLFTTPASEHLGIAVGCTTLYRTGPYGAIPVTDSLCNTLT